jgi:Fe-S-cluster containining protein
MKLSTKVRQVEQMFDRLDHQIDQFRKKSGLKCISGCGACCQKPDIEATILEFLPLAHHFYKQGKLEELFHQVEQDPQNPLCILFKPFITGMDQGFCSAYAQRGLICRLFGFSASKDKNGKPVLATCRKIKENFRETYEKVVADIKSGLEVPIISNSYYTLSGIDFTLSQKFYPINQAIRFAAEVIYIHYFYRNKKAS